MSFNWFWIFVNDVEGECFDAGFLEGVFEGGEVVEDAAEGP